MSIRHRIAGLVLPFLVIASACSDDPLPTGSEEGHGHEESEATTDLSVDFTVSPDHVHILSEVTFTVTVTDHHGEAVTSFEVLRVERRQEGADEWHETELQLDGQSYVGTHTFASSGDYEIRVAGRRPEDAEAVVLYERSEHLHAARAHADAGGYSVEFESFPGHVHEGESATLRFWVSEDDGSTPVTGLTPEVHVVEADDSEGSHGATESDPGVYEAAHGFVSAGDATVGLHFTGSDGSPAEAEFTLPVAHAHSG